jgi:hypothetical protein
MSGQVSNILVDDVAQMSWWHKCHVGKMSGGTNVGWDKCQVGQMSCGTKVMVGQMSHFIIGGTNVTFYI